MTLTALLAVTLAAIVAIIATWSATYFRMRRRMDTLRQENSRLQGEIEVRMQVVEEKKDLKKQLTQSAGEPPSAGIEHRDPSAGRIEPASRESFPQIAGAQRGPLQSDDGGAVHPASEVSAGTDRHLRAWQQERQEAVAALRARVDALAEARSSLYPDHGERVVAPGRVGDTGRWGEPTLKRVIELAGVAEHCTFHEQEPPADRGTPYALVHMPEGRAITIDAGPPVDAYIAAAQASDPSQRYHHRAHYARAVRDKVEALAGEADGSHLDAAPEFVVLFIPGEQFLGAALDIDPELQQQAGWHNVVLSTPTNLVALLSTVALGWRQYRVAENAEQMRREGIALYERVIELTEQLRRVGTQFHNSRDAYDRAVRSVREQAVCAGQRMTPLAPQRPTRAKASERIDMPHRERDDGTTDDGTQEAQ